MTSYWLAQADTLNRITHHLTRKMNMVDIDKLTQRRNDEKFAYLDFQVTKLTKLVQTAQREITNLRTRAQWNAPDYHNLVEISDSMENQIDDMEEILAVIKLVKPGSVTWLSSPPPDATDFDSGYAFKNETKHDIE